MDNCIHKAWSTLRATRFFACCLIFIVPVFCGCIHDKENPACTNKFIEINTFISGNRVTGSNFDPGDRIGLYAAVSPGVPANENYASNSAYTYDGSRWTAPGGSPLPWPGAVNLDIYAYWPFDPGLTDANPREYPFVISTDQSTEQQYIDNDFLWAAAHDRSPSGSIPLIFSHTFSRVQINIKASFDAGEGWPQNAEAAILGLAREMTIDLADGSLTTTGTNGSLTPAQNPGESRMLVGTALRGELPSPREEEQIIPLSLSSPETDYDISFAAILMPQAVSSGMPLVHIHLDGNNYVFIPSDDFVLAPGENLTMNLTLTDEWPGLILDIEDIDWEQSRVWNVYNGNRIIGRVCREYLFRRANPTIDQIAEVVYPADEDGKVDLTAGFVARVYNRTPNRVSNSYEYNTASVHGGRAVFGPKDTLYTYTSGNLPLIGKVRFGQEQHIEAADVGEAANLSLRPYLLTDGDGNEYPTVKIGTQYWIRKNYGAEHSMDGNPVTHYYYNNDAASYKEQYGALYTWDTAVSAGMVPSGWRVPSREDWQSIWHYLYPDMGKKIKTLGIWSSPLNSEDASGFSAPPGGRRTNTGAYNEMGSYGQWWGSTQIDANVGYRIYVGTGTAITESSLNKNYAESLRLMKDN